MDNQRCENCRYFDIFDSIEQSGFCRRYPPILIFPQQKDSSPGSVECFQHPLTDYENWCGEWRAKEEKK